MFKLEKVEEKRRKRRGKEEKMRGVEEERRGEEEERTLMLFAATRLKRAEAAGAPASQ